MLSSHDHMCTVRRGHLRTTQLAIPGGASHTMEDLLRGSVPSATRTTIWHSIVPQRQHHTLELDHRWWLAGSTKALDRGSRHEQSSNWVFSYLASCNTSTGLRWSPDQGAYQAFRRHLCALLRQVCAARQGEDWDKQGRHEETIVS